MSNLSIVEVSFDKNDKETKKKIKQERESKNQIVVLRIDGDSVKNQR